MWSAALELWKRHLENVDKVRRRCRHVQAVKTLLNHVTSIFDLPEPLLGCFQIVMCTKYCSLGFSHFTYHTETQVLDKRLVYFYIFDWWILWAWIILELLSADGGGCCWAGLARRRCTVLAVIVLYARENVSLLLVVICGSPKRLCVHLPVKITLPQLSSGEKLGSTQVVSRIARFIVLLVILQTVIKFHLISACWIIIVLCSHYISVRFSLTILTQISRGPFLWPTYRLMIMI